MSNAVAHPEPEAARAVVATPMEMLQTALTNGASVDTMEKLLALQERWEKGNARRAFDHAMAEIRGVLPDIVKDREVNYVSGGKTTNYRFEDLSSITRALSPVMHDHGLSFRWRTDSESGRVSVTCIVSHRDGHVEETTLSAAPDTSGGKNPIQAIGSAVTYLQRYTLKAAMGIAASNDDDGIASGPRGGEEGFPGDRSDPPIKSSAQLKREGSWQAVHDDLMQDLQDCDTMNGLDKLKDFYRERVRKEGWNRTYTAQLKEIFLQAEDRINAEPVE